MTPQPTSPSLWAAAGYTGGTTPKCTREAPPSSLQQYPWKSFLSFSRMVIKILFTRYSLSLHPWFSLPSPPHHLSIYILFSSHPSIPSPPPLSFPLYPSKGTFLPLRVTPGMPLLGEAGFAGHLCWLLHSPSMASPHALISSHIRQHQGPGLTATYWCVSNGTFIGTRVSMDVSFPLSFMAQVAGPKLHCHRDLCPSIGQFYCASHGTGVTCCSCAYSDCWGRLETCERDKVPGGCKGCGSSLLASCGRCLLCVPLPWTFWRGRTQNGCVLWHVNVDAFLPSPLLYAAISITIEI